VQSISNRETKKIKYKKGTKQNNTQSIEFKGKKFGREKKTSDRQWLHCSNSNEHMSRGKYCTVMHKKKKPFFSATLEERRADTHTHTPRIFSP
jgi:hypothetical protein